MKQGLLKTEENRVKSRTGLILMGNICPGSGSSTVQHEQSPASTKPLPGSYTHLSVLFFLGAKSKHFRSIYSFFFLLYFLMVHKFLPVLELPPKKKAFLFFFFFPLCFSTMKMSMFALFFFSVKVSVFIFSNEVSIY